MWDDRAGARIAAFKRSWLHRRLAHGSRSARVVQSYALASASGASAGYWRDSASGREVDLVLAMPRARCAHLGLATHLATAR